MIDPSTLLIRADASTQIGTGHVMRCLALAQSWVDKGGSVLFLSLHLPDGLIPRFHKEGIRLSHLSAVPGSLEDAVECATLAHEIEANWVVIDGYQFNAYYQKIIKEQNINLLVIDDYGHAEHYFADIVLNQNLHAREELYINKEPYTQLLLGPKYVLLRREFLQWRGWERTIPEKASNILVTLGGSDPDNITLKVIHALQILNCPKLVVKIILGSKNPNIESIKSTLTDSKLDYELLFSVDNMPELMAWAELAVSAAGSTCWELAFMGLPALVCPIADNQREIAEELGRLGVARNLGWYEDVDTDAISHNLESLILNTALRQQMSKKGIDLINGRGSNRAIQQLKGINEYSVYG